MFGKTTNRKRLGTLSKSTKKDWKSEAVSRGQTIRRLRQKVKRQKACAKKWRERFYDLKRQDRLRSVPRYSYKLEWIWLAICMRINGNVSWRGISQSLSSLAELYGSVKGSISPSTIRSWCLKYGLYLLLKPIAKGSYVLLCDESVEIGREHLMVVLAVPVQAASPIAPLRMQDVQVLALGVQGSWKAQQVAEMIQAKQQAYDLEFVYGISDKDSMLKNAYAACGVPWIGDCTHQLANSAKALFRQDEAFNDFIQQLNALRAKWILSKHNYYVPPALRAKNRFHQLFVIHKWAQSILRQWDSIATEAQLELAFVKEAESTVEEMRHFHDLIAAFAHIFKSKGIQSHSLGQWNGLVEKYRKEHHLSSKAQQFIVQMDGYLTQQQATAPHLEQILCCSDIIESMFGKYKNKGGMKMITDDVLQLAAYADDTKLEEVLQAMRQISVRDLQQWKEKNTTVSKLALIKRAKRKKTAA